MSRHQTQANTLLWLIQELAFQAKTLLSSQIPEYTITINYSRNQNSYNMDVVTAAATLHQQLVSLHNSDTTVSILESRVTSLGHQCLMSAVEDNQSKHLRLVLHLSVTEGIHHMYQHYSTSKWAQVQNTARTIKSTLEADNTEQSETLMTSSMTSSTGARSSSDKAMAVWSSVFCEMSRHE